MRQTKFEFSKDYKKSFGGKDLIGKRKSQRPLSTKLPLHLILKANQKKVFVPGNRRLQRLIQRLARKFYVRVYDVAINWSHIHFLIQIRERQDYVRFIRALTSKLAMAVQKVSPKSKTKLFTLRPFTRIISWGRDYKNAVDYLAKNCMESFGWIRREKKIAVSIPVTERGKVHPRLGDSDIDGRFK